MRLFDEKLENVEGPDPTNPFGYVPSFNLVLHIRPFDEELYSIIEAVIEKFFYSLRVGFVFSSRSCNFTTNEIFHDHNAP